MALDLREVCWTHKIHSTEELGRSSQEPLIANLTWLCCLMETGKCRKSHLLGDKSLHINTCAGPKKIFSSLAIIAESIFKALIWKILKSTDLSIWEAHQKPQIRCWRWIFVWVFLLLKETKWFSIRLMNKGLNRGKNHWPAKKKKKGKERKTQNFL